MFPYPISIYNVYNGILVGAARNLLACSQTDECSDRHFKLQSSITTKEEYKTIIRIKCKCEQIRRHIIAYKNLPYRNAWGKTNHVHHQRDALQ